MRGQKTSGFQSLKIRFLEKRLSQNDRIREKRCSEQRVTAELTYTILRESE